MISFPEGEEDREEGKEEITGKEKWKSDEGTEGDSKSSSGSWVYFYHKL